jgi:hypothetical protein
MTCGDYEKTVPKARNVIAHHVSGGKMRRPRPSPLQGTAPAREPRNSVKSQNPTNSAQPNTNKPNRDPANVSGLPPPNCYSKNRGLVLNIGRMNVGATLPAGRVGRNSRSTLHFAGAQANARTRRNRRANPQWNLDFAPNLHRLNILQGLPR